MYFILQTSSFGLLATDDQVRRLLAAMNTSPNPVTSNVHVSASGMAATSPVLTAHANRGTSSESWIWIPFEKSKSIAMPYADQYSVPDQ